MAGRVGGLPQLTNLYDSFVHFIGGGGELLELGFPLTDQRYVLVLLELEEGPEVDLVFLVVLDRGQAVFGFVRNFLLGGEPHQLADEMGFGEAEGHQGVVGVGQEVHQHQPVSALVCDFVIVWATDRTKGEARGEESMASDSHLRYWVELTMHCSIFVVVISVLGHSSDRTEA